VQVPAEVLDLDGLKVLDDAYQDGDAHNEREQQAPVQAGATKLAT